MTHSPTMNEGGGRSRFAAACKRPFSNGTEGDAWMSAWCSYCVHDHGMHEHDSCGPGCDLILVAMTDGWPEGWIPEPDDGSFSLPSRLVCTRFTACDKEGCDGDPGAEDRAERVAEVTAYWKANR